MEQRRRILIYLPNRSLAENNAFERVLFFLLAQREKPLAVRGYSRTDGTAGYWLSSRDKWIRDRISLIILDAFHEPSVDTVLNELKAFAHEAYRLEGRAQDEIWIISHDVTRCTGNNVQN